VQAGGLDWFVNGAPVVLAGRSAPLFEVMAEWMGQTEAPSLSVARSVDLVWLAEKEAGRRGCEVEAICFANERC
jgi:hypothetical protein